MKNCYFYSNFTYFSLKTPAFNPHSVSRLSNKKAPECEEKKPNLIKKNSIFTQVLRNFSQNVGFLGLILCQKTGI